MNKRSKKFLKSASKAGGIKELKKGRKRLKSRSDEDDLEVEETETTLPVRKILKSSSEESDASTKKVGVIGKHRNELQNLRDADPEFFEFLKENDSQILEFGHTEEDDDDVEDEVDDDEDVDDDVETDDMKLQTTSSEQLEPESNFGRNDPIEVSAEFIQAVVGEAKSGSLTALRALTTVLRTACIPHGDDDDDDDEEGDARANAARAHTRYKISSPEIYNEVMVNVLENAHIGFRVVLDVEEITEDVVEAMAENPKWKKIRLLVLSFFKSVLHTLSGLAVSNTDGQVSAYLVNCLEDYVAFLAPMPRLTKNVLKVLLGLWAASATSEHDSINVRGYVFLRIRQMCLVLPGATMEECFRAMYLAYARMCKGYNETTAPSLAFAAECIEALYSLDAAQAYQQAFLYIRQLALHLRAAVLKKTSEASKQLVTWQFLCCIRLWTKIVCAMNAKEELAALAFPLAQVVLGFLASAPSAYSLPFKFHLITCLHQLAACCQIFIPTASKLCEVLELPDLFSKQTPTTEVAPVLHFLVKLPPESLTKAVVRDAIVQEVMALVHQDAEIYRFNVGYPEYTFLTARKLKAFAKKAKVSKWRDLAKTLAGHLEHNAAAVKVGRAALGQAPMSITAFEPLLPGGSPNAAQRIAKLLGSKGPQASANGGHLMAKKDGAEKAKLKAAGGGSEEKGRQSGGGSGGSKKSAKVAAKSLSAPTKKGDGKIVTADKIKEFEWSDDEDEDN